MKIALYNEMLEQLKEHYQQTGEFLFKYALTKRFKGRGGQHVPATTVQTLADRLDKALKRFLERKNLGEKVGFPRFKRANRWHSIQLRQYGSGRDVFLDSNIKRLHVPKKLGGRIKIKQHRPLEGTPKTAHLIHRADGHWYALIVCKIESVPKRTDETVIGLDVGLKVFLADSGGKTVENPRCYRSGQKKLRRAQRKLSRRKKGSNRRKKAARQVCRTSSESLAPAQGLPAQDSRELRPEVRDHRGRRPECQGDVPQSPPRGKHPRCELVRLHFYPREQG